MKKPQTDPIVINTIEKGRTVVEAFTQKVAINIKILADAQYAQKIRKPEPPQYEFYKKNTLVSYDFTHAYSPEVNHFVNKQTILMNLNQEKQKALLQACKSQQWEDGIFQDELFLETAFALFAKGDLKRPTFETLLLMHYARTSLQDSVRGEFTRYLPLKAYAFLDENHEFTEAAEKCVLPLLEDFMKGSLQSHKTKQHLQFICQAFFEKNPAENVFFISRIPVKDMLIDGLAMSLFNLSTCLYVDVYRMFTSPFALYQQQFPGEPLQKVVLSCSIRDAMKLAWADVKDVVVARSVAGVLSPSVIAQHVEQDLWPADVSFNRVPRTETLHGGKIMHNFSRRDHDDYHSDVLTMQGKAWRQLTQAILIPISCQMAESCTNITLKQNTAFSKLTYDLVESEFQYVNYAPETINNLSSGKLFSKIFSYEAKYPRNNVSYYLYKGHALTDFGVLVFLSMASKPELWESAGFNHKDMSYSYRRRLQIITEISQYDDNYLEWYILMYRMHEAFGEKDFKIYQDCFVAFIHEIESSVSFIRNNKTRFIGLANKNSGAITEYSLPFIFLVHYMDDKYEQFEVDLEAIDKQQFKRNTITIGLLSKIIFKLAYHLGDSFYIQDKVIFPLYDELLSKIHHDKYEKMNDIAFDLKQFYYHHNNKQNSAYKPVLPILYKITKEFFLFFAEPCEHDKDYIVRPQ